MRIMRNDVCKEILESVDRDTNTALLFDLVRDGIDKAYPDYETWREIAIGCLSGDEKPNAHNHDPAAYWKVAPDVQLTRYRATNVTRLIAVRKGRQGNDDVIFEIFINRKTKKETIKRDDTVLFTIGVDGLSAGRLQTAGISVLRSYLRQNDHAHNVCYRIRHRLAEERKAAMENAASDEGSHE